MSVVLLCVALLASSPGHAQTLEALYARLFATPDDLALNMAYGLAAEQAGESRQAYAAYARAVRTAPGDAVASAAYQRLKASLQPRSTTVVAYVGESYATNPRLLPSSERGRPRGLIDDGTADGGVRIADERSVGNIRWRTTAEGFFQAQHEAHDVNVGYVTAASGPVFELRDKVWLHLAPVVSSAWVGGDHVFTDIAGRAVLSMLAGGLIQSVHAQVNWRDVNEFFRGASDGLFIDVHGRFMMKPGLLRGDMLHVIPQFAASKPTGNGPGVVFNRPIFVADYLEAGNRIGYYFPVLGARAVVGAGFSYYHRWYEQNVALRTDKRRDDYIEPTAHLIFPSLLAPQVDLRFDYRYEHNFSNEPLERFENHVVGGRIVGRF